MKSEHRASIALASGGRTGWRNRSRAYEPVRELLLRHIRTSKNSVPMRQRKRGERFTIARGSGSIIRALAAQRMLLRGSKMSLESGQAPSRFGCHSR